jgi:ADP-heptose:LPS heptosyltransferase
MTSTYYRAMAAQALHPFVFKLGRIGDMVMLTSALRLLHERYRKPCYLVGADAWLPDVYAGLPEVAQCWPLPRKLPSFLGLAWPAILRALRASAPGPVYVFEHHQGQVRRIRHLLRLGGVDARRCLFIGEAPHGETPWLDALLRFAKATPPGLRAADHPVPVCPGGWAPRLRVLDAEKAEREYWLRARGYRGEPIILVQPGNHRTMGRRRLRNWRGRDDKVWPVQRWAELLHRLHARMPEAVLVLRGAAAERPLLDSIHAAAGLSCVIPAVTGLRPLFALCERAHSMISIDSGPAHAAAALGLPLLVLYGAQPAGTWLPRSSNGSPVAALGGPPALQRVDQLSVEAVFASWCELVDAAAAARQAAAQAADFEPAPAPPSIHAISVAMEPSALSSSVR